MPFANFSGQSAMQLKVGWWQRMAGLSHTFFSAVSDRARAGELINVLREAGQTVPAELLQFGTTVKKKESKLYGAHFKEIDPMQKSSKVTFDFDD